MFGLRPKRPSLRPQRDMMRLRVESLEQRNMFAGVVDAELSYVESAILKIQNAKSQDDINDVYADPAFDELSGADRERLDKEAQQRESELQD